MSKALSLCDAKLFVAALRENISICAFATSKKGSSWGTDFNNLTYGTFPTASKKQQEDFGARTEQLILLFCATCLLKGDPEVIPRVLKELIEGDGFIIRSELIYCLQSNGPAKDSYMGFANLIHTITKSEQGAFNSPPRAVFQLALRVLQTAKLMGSYQIAAENLLPWLNIKLAVILEQQRFLLRQPTLYEKGIKTALKRDGVSADTKVVEVMMAFLPALGINNQQEVLKILSGLSNKSG